MNNSGKLAGRTLFITGASRGIGKAIALKAAKDGANIVIAAKTVDPHPKLPGTIYTAAKEIEAAGGRALACVVDVRDENQVRAAVEEAVRKFGGIDIVINNASAISLTGTADTEMKRYDLMQNINARGTFLVSKECLPYLKKSSHAHILNISPPLSMAPHWFSNHVAYTIAKYGMSLCVLGMHEEFKHFGIGVNALWPKTTIYTAAVEMLSGSEAADFSRKPEIMADAAYAILTQDPRNASGNFYIDEYILKESGVEDLDQYACNFLHKDNLVPDLFVDNNPREIPAEAPHYTKKGNKSTGKPKGKVADAFQLIERKLNKEMLTDIEGVYKFVLKGEEAGEWFMELINGSISYGCGSSSSKPDSTLTMDSDVFISMFSGKVKPTVAYMTGKLRIEGNVKQGLRLEKLTNELKSKL